MTNAIEIQDVWKQFVVRHNHAYSLKMKFLGLFNSRFYEKREVYWALKGINLTVGQGEALGLVGPNGTGKTTLLYLIAKTLQASKGKIVSRGRIAPMIDIGLGFEPELTGRENVYLTVSLFGLSSLETNELYGPIVDFSELGELIDTPLKNYSTGMRARLGFAIAMQLNPDILLIDEVLAVGDEYFQKKCLAKMLEIKKSGKTIIFVSHNLQDTRMICDSACLLLNGVIAERGEVSKVLDTYLTRSSMQPRSD